MILLTNSIETKNDKTSMLEANLAMFICCHSSFNSCDHLIELLSTSKISERQSVTFLDHESTAASPPTGPPPSEATEAIEVETPSESYQISDIQIEIDEETFSLEDVESTEMLEKRHKISASDLQSNVETRIQVYRLACHHFKVLPMTTFITNIHKTDINLEHLGITPKEAHAMSIPLRNIEYVEELNLSDNRLSDEGATFIFEILTFGNRIKSLDSGYIIMINLSHNHFTENCAELVGTLIEKNSFITSLDISWNMLGKKGAKSISRGLQKNSSLEYFNIAFNNIGNEGCNHLKTGIGVNNTLKIFDMSTNNITSDGIKMLAKDLKCKPSMHPYPMQAFDATYSNADLRYSLDQ
ncbi:leucine-rich repeat-containing protein 74A [Octopus vulgaris]|uniref:Leucine-rich repeat-containing protein 74A n=1 Tax=Octopus vulgaris TaxID=6645 RepID=A0AA36BPX2_OCTVU|nr:leucine-rich repeat-containing protein 74A [Octopus vulgaris]